MTNAELTKTNEDWCNEYYTSYFEGYPIKFIKNKLTGEIHIDADKVVQAMGIASDFNEYLGTDEGLDLINEWNRKYPDMPFFGTAIKTKSKRFR